MLIRRTLPFLFGTLLVVSGCSYADNLFGNGTRADAGARTTSKAAVAGAPGSAPQVFADRKEPADTNAVPQDAADLRAAVDRLKGALAARRQEQERIDRALAEDQTVYSTSTAELESRLKSADATALMGSWSRAQAAVDRMNDALGWLSTLSAQATSDAQRALRLGDALQSAAEKAGPGADSRTLAQMGNEAEGVRAQLDTMRDDLKAEMPRVGDAIVRHRGELADRLVAIKDPRAGRATLVAAEGTPRLGTSGSAAAPRAMAARAPSGFADRRPFVIIRFDRPDVSYETELRGAMRRALARQPESQFDVVAVTANDGSASGLAANAEASKRNLAAVVRSLAGMGVTFDRIILSASTATDATADEVRIYLH